MPNILDGLRVLDMGHVVAVPAGTAMMADWGAEVIKIEPLRGELARGLGYWEEIDGKVVQRDPNWVSWYVQLLNRNKKSIAVNLKSEIGKEILYKLVKTADVFASNYELSTLDNLKASYQDLKKINPRIIYAVINGYGMHGPDKDERGFDYSAGWARSGIMHMMGEPGCIPPPQRGGLIDRTIGSYMVAGILGAILHRDKTGEGQKLELSLYQTAVWTNAEDIQSTSVGPTYPRHIRTRAVNPLWNEYKTKDGRWFWMAMLQPDPFWPDFCRAIGKPDLENDSLYNSSPARWENCEKLIAIIDEIILSKTLAEWEEIFRANNVLYGVVATPAEVLNDPQAIANNFLVDLNHPGTNMKVVATPVNFVQNPAGVRNPAPELGQHTEELLLELGYNWEDIARLKDQKIIL